LRSRVCDALTASIIVRVVEARIVNANCETPVSLTLQLRYRGVTVSLPRALRLGVDTGRFVISLPRIGGPGNAWHDRARRSVTHPEGDNRWSAGETGENPVGVNGGRAEALCAGCEIPEAGVVAGTCFSCL